MLRFGTAGERDRRAAGNEHLIRVSCPAAHLLLIHEEKISFSNGCFRAFDGYSAQLFTIIERVFRDLPNAVPEGDGSQAAAGKSAAADAENAAGDGDFRQLPAPVEGFIPDFGHTVTESDRRQGITAFKGAFPDFLYGAGNPDFSQLTAAGKRGGTDFRDAVRNGNGGQIIRVAESIAADGFRSFRNFISGNARSAQAEEERPPVPGKQRAVREPECRMFIGQDDLLQREAGGEGTTAQFGDAVGDADPLQRRATVKRKIADRRDAVRNGYGKANPGA